MGEIHNLIADPFDLPLHNTEVFVKMRTGETRTLARTGWSWYATNDPGGKYYPLYDAEEWAYQTAN